MDFFDRHLYTFEVEDFEKESGVLWSEQATDFHRVGRQGDRAGTTRNAGHA